MDINISLIEDTANQLREAGDKQGFSVHVHISPSAKETRIEFWLRADGYPVTTEVRCLDLSEGLTEYARRRMVDLALLRPKLAPPTLDATPMPF